MTSESIITRRRRRQLASDNRTAVWNRRRIREQRWYALRTLRTMIVYAVLATAATIAAAVVLIPSTFASGLLTGLVTASMIATVGYAVVMLSGTASTAMGTAAEMWTASELRALRRRNWRVVNGVPLENRDIDHVLIGPGGVVVVESKFRSDGWRVDPPDSRVMDAVVQVERNARSIRLWLARELAGAPVTSVLFLWSGLRPDQGERATGRECVRDTAVLRGRAAITRWRDSLIASDESLSGEDVDRVCTKFSTFVDSREGDEQVRPPASLDRIVATAMATLVAFTATLIGTLRIASITGLSWPLAAALAALAGAAVFARRLPLLRIPALGVLAALAIVATVTALAGLLVVS